MSELRLSIKDQLASCKDHVSHKKCGNNTVEWIDRFSNRYIRLHHIDILTFTPNCSIIISSGGWRTYTTKARINSFLPAPWRVSQSNSQWYLFDNSSSYVFQDGITILSDNTVTGAGDDSSCKDLKKSVAKYIETFLDKLHNRKLPAPSAGDCFFCSLHDSQTGRLMGESEQGISDKEHILSHIREEYHVSSLLIHVCQSSVSDLVKMYVHACLYPSNASESFYQSWKSVADRQIKSALRKYIYRAVNLAA